MVGSAAIGELRLAPAALPPLACQLVTLPRRSITTGGAVRFGLGTMIGTGQKWAQ